MVAENNKPNLSRIGCSTENIATVSHSATYRPETLVQRRLLQSKISKEQDAQIFASAPIQDSASLGIKCKRQFC